MQVGLQKLLEQIILFLPRFGTGLLIFSNLLAGILILIYRPFGTGDFIETTALGGKVIEINLRYVVLEGEGEKILIPNSNLLTNAIVVKR